MRSAVLATLASVAVVSAASLREAAVSVATANTDYTTNIGYLLDFDEDATDGYTAYVINMDCQVKQWDLASGNYIKVTDITTDATHGIITYSEYSDSACATLVTADTTFSYGGTTYQTAPLATTKPTIPTGDIPSVATPAGCWGATYFTVPQKRGGVYYADSAAAMTACQNGDVASYYIQPASGYYNYCSATADDDFYDVDVGCHVWNDRVVKFTTGTIYGDVSTDDDNAAGRLSTGIAAVATVAVAGAMAMMA